MELYFAFLGVIFVVWMIWRKQHLSLFKKLGIPGPEPNLLFGNLLQLYIKGPLQCHEEWKKKYGRVVGYFYGMEPVLLVTDPEILKNVFIKDFPKFINRKPFHPLSKYDPHKKTGQSVLILEGKRWKQVRSVLTPTFTATKMKQMSGSMISSIETLLDVMKVSAKSGKELDAWDVYQRVTLDIITRTAFGVRTDVQTNFKSKLLKVTKLLFSFTYRDPLIFIGLSFPFLNWFCRRIQGFILGILNGCTYPHTHLRKNVKTVLNHRRNNPQGTKCDLLQLMIDSKISTASKEVDTKILEIGKAENEANISKEDDTISFRRMTDDEILSTSTTVLVAGYETTSTALSFTTYLIAKHQDIQQKLYEEVNELIKSGQNLEYGTISKLQYLEKVLNESLRVYPPGLFFNNRVAVEDVQYGNLKIPTGMIIQAPVHNLHHDPEFWENPEVFDPERFDDKMTASRVVYMPFGAGPRNCLGMRFAQVEAKLVLAHVVHKFKITLADETKGDMELFLKIRSMVPKNGVKLKLELRENK